MTSKNVKLGFNEFKSVKPQAMRLSQEAVIKTSYINDEMFPLVIGPNLENFNLASWAESNKPFIESELLKHGAILFRGFSVETVDQFTQFVRSISPDLLDYTERAAPRTEVSRKVYTSTEYPPDQYIPLHHEMSYSHNWPTKIWFMCARSPLKGGRTPIACDRKVFALIPASIKEEFIRKRVMYVRNYGEGVDLPWQEVFQTTDRSVVEEYCRKARTEFDWLGDDRLRTRQVRQAIAIHPRTGETVWFNHAHLFHSSNLSEPVRNSLLAEFKEDEIPRNAFYGDGSPIESPVLEEIRGIYQEAAVAFCWREGDILMLDNFLSSHGREPYQGSRQILVAMAELFTNPD